MTVYIDSAFFVNACFDAEILGILLKLYSKKISPARFIFCALFGGLSGILVFIPYFNMPGIPFLRYTVPLIIVYIAFSPCKIKELLPLWALFLGISFLFSGIVVFFRVNTFFALLIPAPLYILISCYRRKITQKKLEVTLIYKDNIIKTEGFYDSGNMLFSGNSPVILGDKKIFELLFGKGFSFSYAEEFIDKKDIRIVSYATLGKEGAVLGIRLDCVLVGNNAYENVVLGELLGNFSQKLILSSVMS